MGCLSHRVVITTCILLKSQHALCVLRFFVPLFTLAQCFASTSLLPPNPAAKAVDQSPIHENGCGPVSLLNSYLFGQQSWQELSQKIPGNSQAKFNYLIKKHAFQFSPHAYLRRRWDKDKGMLPRDLRDMTNDFHQSAKHPPVVLYSLFANKSESPTELLNRVHTTLKCSMTEGLPPILKLTRFGQIKHPNGSSSWAILQGHYITLYSIPNVIPTNTESIAIEYIDPVGGRILPATIHFPKSNFYGFDISAVKNRVYRINPCLTITCPHTIIGEKAIGVGQSSAIGLTHCIGLSN